MSTSEEELKSSIDRLTKIQAALLKNQNYWRSLLHGIVVGVGGTVGAAVAVALMLAILNRIAGIPGIGHWFDGLRLILQHTASR